MQRFWEVAYISCRQVYLESTHFKYLYTCMLNTYSAMHYIYYTRSIHWHNILHIIYMKMALEKSYALELLTVLQKQFINIIRVINKRKRIFCPDKSRWSFFANRFWTLSPLIINVLNLWMTTCIITKINGTCKRSINEVRAVLILQLDDVERRLIRNQFPIQWVRNEVTQKTLKTIRLQFAAKTSGYQ